MNDNVRNCTLQVLAGILDKGVCEVCETAMNDKILEVVRWFGIGYKQGDPPYSRNHFFLLDKHAREFFNEKDTRLHPDFNIVGCQTGRFDSSRQQDNNFK